MHAFTDLKAREINIYFVRDIVDPTNEFNCVSDLVQDPTAPQAWTIVLVDKFAWHFDCQLGIGCYSQKIHMLSPVGYWVELHVAR